MRALPAAASATSPSAANRHLTSHFKFQANYVHVLDEKREAYSASVAVELRAQLQF